MVQDDRITPSSWNLKGTLAPITIQIRDRVKQIYSNLGKELEDIIAKEEIIYYWSNRRKISMEQLPILEATFHHACTNSPLYK